MDHTINVWDLEFHKEFIELSYGWDKPPSMFKTRFVEIPAFSTNRVHDNYVDCVKWCGDLLLSKSINNCVVLWKPVYGEDGNSDSAIPLKIFKLTDCDMWFVKFSISMDSSLMALGNCTGNVYIWDLEKGQEQSISRPLASKKGELVIRHTSVSYKNRFLVACGSGVIACWPLYR